MVGEHGRPTVGRRSSGDPRTEEHARETAQEIMHDRTERACVLGEEEADEGVPHPEHHRAGIAHLALRWTPPPKTSSQSTATRRQRSSKEAT
ncbi:Os10g0370900 [Oryza sativa Japonica Group]|uniref:Os10g0370900 protein n=1 Tax=Oryza sativa subsp. japonica TaxID=39947 RepID=A0A0P0XU07_ORYSJ|nr:Os10g0370900 [Oryza sativa Japonica Group]